MNIPSAMLVAAITTWLPSLARAQARVTQIVAPDSSAVDSTDDVQLTPFGFARSINVSRERGLGFGDELTAKSGKTIVVLACSDTAGITLEGEFRVAIMPRPGKACFLDLFAGAAHVMGDTSTGLGLGDVTMGAKRTHYRVAISRSGNEVRRDLEVFDGEVEVDSAPGAPAIVSAGFALAMARGALRRNPITQRQVASAASLYAAIDASRVGRDQRTAVVRSLTTAYRRVLTHPDSSAARLDLIGEQVKYQATTQRTLYQIERVKATAPRTSQLDATTTALSVAAYTQLGQEDKAAAGYQVLRQYDPQMVQSALRAYRIDPEIVSRAGRFDTRVAPVVPQRPLPPAALTLDTLRVLANADPATIPTGGRTRIVVQVATRAGAPVRGATVRVSAGGGAFADGGTQADGVTGADGSFGVVWSCKQCAPGYGFSIEVVMQGFVPVKTNASVRIR